MKPHSYDRIQPYRGSTWRRTGRGSKRHKVRVCGATACRYSFRDPATGADLPAAYETLSCAVLLPSADPSPSHTPYPNPRTRPYLGGHDKDGGGGGQPHDAVPRQQRLGCEEAREHPPRVLHRPVPRAAARAAADAAAGPPGAANRQPQHYLSRRVGGWATPAAAHQPAGGAGSPAAAAGRPPCGRQGPPAWQQRRQRRQQRGGAGVQHRQQHDPRQRHHPALGEHLARGDAPGQVPRVAGEARSDGLRGETARARRSATWRH